MHCVGVGRGQVRVTGARPLSRTVRSGEVASCCHFVTHYWARCGPHVLAHWVRIASACSAPPLHSGLPATDLPNSTLLPMTCVLTHGP